MEELIKYFHSFYVPSFFSFFFLVEESIVRLS